ncbi:macrolide 2'-phosphotransferase [Brevibacterium album]|uniref:macrolide 2'-phosphotransferase n=1 Tax=Brevibacterium album TaxID=417948 RepID=UPI000411A881|nr:macrolide 2'-phosphotransferase [Brevibacterium album]
MTAPDSALRAEIAERAAAHGLDVDAETMRTVEAGLDYRVAFASAEDGTEWVLRIPRRADVSEKVADEARILGLVRDRLPAAVPDWRISGPDLIAYPRLPGEPGLTLSTDGEPQWHFDREDPHYARSFGRLIAHLHGIGAEDARAAGVSVRTADEERAEWRARLERASAAFAISDGLRASWEVWLDDDGLWPEFTALTHGELYPAHLLLDSDGEVRSVLDWTTAKVGDPAVDFMYHHMLSGPEAFRLAVEAYAELTGRVPRRLGERCEALLSAGPLSYAEYALTTGDPEHAAAAQAQLTPTDA